MIAKVTPLARLPRQIDFFDYFVPPSLEAKIKAGSLVKIPWRKTYCEGVVLEIEKESPVNKKLYRARPISALLKPGPVLTPAQLSFLKKFSAYYFLPVGYAIRLALPAIPWRKAAARQPAQHPEEINFPIAKTQLPALENFFEKYKNFPPDKILIQDLSSAIWFIQKLTAGTERIIHLYLPTKEWVSIFLRIFRKNFSGRVAVYHGDLGKNEAWQNYQQILNGTSKLIISTRLGIFLPKTRGDIAVFLDAAAEEFKQSEQSPRYDSRLLAAGKVIFLASSSFPSGSQSLPLLPGAAAHSTNWRIIDMTNKMNRSGIASWLSEAAWREAENNIKCRRKTVFLCLRQTSENEHSPTVERVYSTLTKYIKNVIINKYAKNGVFPKDSDILVTTPIALERLKLALWRGQINSLVICSIEPILSLPDYRKNERAYCRLRHWQMLAQEFKIPDIYLQFFYPDNPVIAALGNNDVENFWREELENRKNFSYPPYSDLIKLAYKGGDKEELGRLKNLLGAFPENDLLLRGPYQSKISGKKEFPALLLKLKNKNLELPLGSLGPDWLIDRDPENVL